jgi:D-glutamate cyclase
VRGLRRAAAPRSRLTREARRDIAPFETLDRLACVELRSHALPSGVVPKLYAMARQPALGGDEPLSLRVASALTDASIRNVAFFTGIVHERQPKGELDGPIGCAVIATALERVGRTAVVFAPAAVLPVIGAARGVLGGRFALEPEERAPECEPKVDAAVSIERLGRNRKGAYHSIFGVPRAQQKAVDDLFDEFNRSGRLTIGIGDGGNEIGFGSIFRAARTVVPRGRDCGCPCGAGIVAHTAVRHLLVASVSNFGAYAVASAMALLEGSVSLAPEPAMIAAAMSAAVDAGGIDGGSMTPGRVADDGIPSTTVAALVTLMRAAVEMQLAGG